MNPNYYQAKYGLLSDGTSVWNRRADHSTGGLDNLVTDKIYSSLNPNTLIQCSSKWELCNNGTDLKIEKFEDILNLVDVYLDCFKQLFEKNLLLKSSLTDQDIKNYYNTIISLILTDIFELVYYEIENNKDLITEFAKYEKNFELLRDKYYVSLFDYQKFVKNWYFNSDTSINP